MKAHLDLSPNHSLYPYKTLNTLLHTPAIKVPSPFTVDSVPVFLKKKKKNDTDISVKATVPASWYRQRR